MPSRFSSAAVLGALVTAVGVVVDTLGLTRHSTSEETTGLVALTAGFIVTLAMGMLHLRRVRNDTATQQAALQGQAFGLALQLLKGGDTDNKSNAHTN